MSHYLWLVKYREILVDRIEFKLISEGMWNSHETPIQVLARLKRPKYIDLIYRGYHISLFICRMRSREWHKLTIVIYTRVHTCTVLYIENKREKHAYHAENTL